MVVNNNKSGITKALNARTAAGKEFYDKFNPLEKLPDNSEGLVIATLNYYIQYGAFSSKNNAKKRLYEVKNKGLEAEIEKFDGYYRVRSQYYDGVGTLLNAEATKARKAGFNILIKSRDV